MKRAVVNSLSLLAIALAACHRGDPGAPAVAIKKPGATGAAVSVTDDELTRFLSWMHDGVAMGNRQSAERDRVIQDASQRANTGDEVATDTAVTEMQARQSDELHAGIAAMPVDHDKAQMLYDGIACVGFYRTRDDLEGAPRKFVAERDPKKIAEARAKYGDEFVAWILAREARIDAALTRD